MDARAARGSCGLHFSRLQPTEVPKLQALVGTGTAQRRATLQSQRWSFTCVAHCSRNMRLWMWDARGHVCKDVHSPKTLGSSSRKFTPRSTDRASSHRKRAGIQRQLKKDGRPDTGQPAPGKGPPPLPAVQRRRSGPWPAAGIQLAVLLQVGVGYSGPCLSHVLVILLVLLCGLSRTAYRPSGCQVILAVIARLRLWALVASHLVSSKVLGLLTTGSCNPV